MFSTVRDLVATSFKACPCEDALTWLNGLKANRPIHNPGDVLTQEHINRQWRYKPHCGSLRHRSGPPPKAHV